MFHNAYFVYTINVNKPYETSKGYVDLFSTGGVGGVGSCLPVINLSKDIEPKHPAAKAVIEVRSVVSIVSGRGANTLYIKQNPKQIDKSIPTKVLASGENLSSCISFDNQLKKFICIVYI